MTSIHYFHVQSSRFFAYSAITLCLLLWTNWVHADGLFDLKEALSRLPGQSNVKANLEIKSTRKQGEDKNAVETTGQIHVGIEDGTRGMSLSYSKETLSKFMVEARAHSKDKESKTPTRNASNEVNTEEAQVMLSATAFLQRLIDEAKFMGEKSDVFNGKPARLLSFEFGMERLTPNDKKYIKSFESSLSIWINAEGIPLASRLVERGSGRAFIVVSFQQYQEQQNVYQVIGDRLVILRRESKMLSSGAGERAETKALKTLQVLS